MTIYEYRDWFEGLTIQNSDYQTCCDYGNLLKIALGEDALLLYMQDEDYQGNWTALVTDGVLIGLVQGSFGSCEGCDWLLSAESAQERVDIIHEYLKSVRTFKTWEDLANYIRGLDPQAWEFRDNRGKILKMAEVDMPLGALDIFGCLMRDNPGRDPIDAAECAKALF